MSSKKYNITAIAKLAGVSPATVSRALNNHPYVTKEVHDKVFDAVHRLGYQPRMPSDRKRLAIIIDNRNMILNSYANTMLFHLSRFCDLHDIRAEIVGYSNLELLEENFLKVAIVFQNFLMEQDARQFPHTQFICINRQIPGYASVCSEEEQGIAAAMRYLAERGHRRIALVLPNASDSRSVILRRGTFCKISAEAGIPDAESLIACIDQKPVEAVARVIRAQKPDALLIAGEDMLFPTSFAVAMLGLSVPEDLSVISYENNYASAYMVPPHTTVAQDFTRLAEHAVNLALEALEGQVISDRHIEVPNSFIERDSVKIRMTINQ